MWHPFFNTTETTPGVWVLADARGAYGRIELRRTPDGPRYRCEHAGTLIGWATTLKTACERVHQAYITAHGPSGPANGERPNPGAQ